MSNPKRKRNSLVSLGLASFILLLVAGGAFAQWKVTNVPNAWDDAAAGWENGNMTMFLNGTPEPFYYDFTDEFDTNTVANACPGPLSTRYAGTGSISLYHTDNNPAGAQGFQSTGNWSLVKCSVLEGPPETKAPVLPADTLYTCTNDNADGDIDRCEIVTQDVVSGASCGGNCQDEIITTLKVNFDTDCNGSLDTNFSSDVCLYWTAVKPAFPAASYWGGNIQARISAGGGDKTLNFTGLKGPTAVKLRRMAAQAAASPVAGVALMAGVVSLAVLAPFGWQLRRRRRR